MRTLGNVFRLGVKELHSLRRDPVMLLLILWAFTLSIHSAATGSAHDLHDAAVAIVDEDRSQLSLRLRQALLPPQFQPPDLIDFRDIDPAMDGGRYTFVLVVPRGFEADLLAGRRPELQIDVDATAMMQAGIGQVYLSNIVAQEVRAFLDAEGAPQAARLEARVAFNPNLTSAWFTGIMELINNITTLSIILTGAALIREREHGTIEHLLVMPLRPLEIMLAKVWANALVILAAVALSLRLVVQEWLDVPIAGSLPLFLAGVLVYLFSSCAIGIFLGTVARSMPQFGLLFMLAILPMMLLSGGSTPIETQPPALQWVMQGVPSTHFVSLAQAILYRGAGFDVVWPDFLAVAAFGAVLFALAAIRFRRSMAAARG